LIVQTLAGFLGVIVAGNPEAIQTPAQTKASPGEDHPLQLPTYAHHDESWTFDPPWYVYMILHGYGLFTWIDIWIYHLRIPVTPVFHWITIQPPFLFCRRMYQLQCPYRQEVWGGGAILPVRLLHCLTIFWERTGSHGIYRISMDITDMIDSLVV